MKKVILMIVTILIIFTGCVQMESDVLSDSYKNSSLETVSEVSDYSNSMQHSDGEESEEVENIKTGKEENDSQDISDRIDDDLNKLVCNIFVYDDLLLNTYKDVLVSKVRFKEKNYSTGIEEEVYLNEIRVDDVSLKIHNFSLIDMNKDCVPELVLETSVGAAEFILVLHSNNDEIYCYWFSNRQMSEIKVDGTFFSSGGAGYYRIDELEFTNDGYIINQLGYHEVGWDEEGNVVISYYLNQEKVSEKEFSSFLDDFKETEDVIWCEFSKAN